MCAAIRTAALAGCVLSACGSRLAAARRNAGRAAHEEQQGLFGLLYSPAQRSRTDAKGGCMQFKRSALSYAAIVKSQSFPRR